MSQTIIHFDPDSNMAKYRQIIQSVKLAIERKRLKKGDWIPSINKVCSEFGLSRDTVLFAYNELKSHGIITSKCGKGYFVESTDIGIEEKIFLLLDEMNSSREKLYNSFIENLGACATVDVFFHHGDFRVFSKQIWENEGKFTSYVIIPDSFDNISFLIRKLPPDRVYILDHLKPELAGYPVIYRDIESDVYENLVAAREQLEKYRRLIMIHPGGKEPAERVSGFRRYCQEYKLDFNVIKSLAEAKPSLYDVFLVPSDCDLVELIKMANEFDFEIGKKFGLISFNDCLLKQVAAGGITTIATDFDRMGRDLAAMVLQKKREQIRNKSGIIIRKSL